MTPLHKRLSGNIVPKKIDYRRIIEDVPDICPSCGQKVDKRNPSSSAHHRTARHLPYVGKRKGGWR